MFSPSRRAVFPAVAKGFCILPLKVDRKPKCQSAGNTYSKVNGIEAWQDIRKCF